MKPGNRSDPRLAIGNQPYWKLKPAIVSLIRSIDYHLNPTVVAIANGSFDPSLLQNFAAQFYLQNRLANHVSIIYMNLDPEVLGDSGFVKYLVDVLEAEEFGKRSGGVRHLETLLEFAEFVGCSRSTLDSTELSHENQLLLDWTELSRFQRRWLECLAVQVAFEGDAAAMRVILNGLKRHYRIPESKLSFWRIHSSPIEKEHAWEGFRFLSKYFRASDKDRIGYVFQTTRKLFHEFLTGLTRRTESKTRS